MTLLMVRFISAKVMPHGGGIVRAHRHRRVVKRREKIGPDVIDFRCGLAHGLDDVFEMGAEEIGLKFSIFVGSFCGLGIRVVVAS